VQVQRFSQAVWSRSISAEAEVEAAEVEGGGRGGVNEALISNRVGLAVPVVVVVERRNADGGLL
jgi:hypothetical protein